MKKSCFSKKLSEDGFYFEIHQSFEANCLQVKQVHGNRIWEAIPGSAGPGSPEEVEADGILIHFKDWSGREEGPSIPILSIRTADCLPVVVLGKTGVANIHAGWRGLKEKILANELIRSIDPRYFYIGPAIQKCCYQVGKEFLQSEELVEFRPHVDLERRHLDLAAVAKEQILKKFPAVTVECSEVCTHCSSSPRLSSYRRDGGDKKNYSRNFNLLIYRGPDFV